MHCFRGILILGSFMISSSSSSVFATFIVPEYYYALNKEYAPAFDNYVPAHYTFEYSVSDPISGDHKSQWEHRKGDTVQGVYTFLEADGTTRYVEYLADKQGFRANVKRIGVSKNNNNFIKNHFQKFEPLPINDNINIITIDHSKKFEPLIKYSPLAFDDVDILVKSYNFGEETEVHGLTGNEEDDSAYTE